jgi:hypothetical protein
MTDREIIDDTITVSREQVTEIFRALNGISNLLRKSVSNSANSAELYAIMSNIAVIRMTLTGMPRANSN